jgi:hypothetical protein
MTSRTRDGTLHRSYGHKNQHQVSLQQTRIVGIPSMPSPCLAHWMWQKMTFLAVLVDAAPLLSRTPGQDELDNDKVNKSCGHKMDIEHLVHRWMPRDLHTPKHHSEDMLRRKDLTTKPSADKDRDPWVPKDGVRPMDQWTGGNLDESIWACCRFALATEHFWQRNLCNSCGGHRKFQDH